MQLSTDIDDVRRFIEDALIAFHMLFTGQTLEHAVLHEYNRRFFEDFDEREDVIREICFQLNFHLRKLMLKIDSDHRESIGSYPFTLPIDMARLPVFVDQWMDAMTSDHGEEYERVEMKATFIERLTQFITAHGPDFRSETDWIAFTYTNPAPPQNAPSTSTVQ